MPTITPQARPTIGGSEDAPISRRTQLTVSTGIRMPESKPAAAAANPTPAAASPAQSGIAEDTTAQAVTLSPQVTAIARRQQKLQTEIQAQRDKEAEWEKGKADFIPKSALKAKVETDILGVLQDLGLTYDQFNERLLAQLNGADPVQELRAEVENLKKSQEEGTNKQYEATLKQYKAEADALVAKDPKAYHLITKGSHQDAIVQHIVDTWKENPDQVLTVEQAAKEIEEVLRENARAAAEALKEIDAPAEAAAQPQKKPLPPPQAAAPRTLPNRVETAPVRAANGQFQHMSMKERIAQAVARAQQR